MTDEKREIRRLNCAVKELREELRKERVRVQERDIEIKRLKARLYVDA